MVEEASDPGTVESGRDAGMEESGCDAGIEESGHDAGTEASGVDTEASGRDLADMVADFAKDIEVESGEMDAVDQSTSVHCSS